MIDIEFLDAKDAEKSLDPGLVKAFGDDITAFKKMVVRNIEEITKIAAAWNTAIDGEMDTFWIAIKSQKKTPEQETPKYKEALLSARKMVLNDALKPLAKYNPKILIHFSTMAPGVQGWGIKLHK